ncbi:MAG: recombinase family protein [Fimbriimonas sp.]
MTNEERNQAIEEYRAAVRRDMSGLVKRGMRRLEERGGFAHMAPLGYRNVRDHEKGAMVVIDPGTEPLVRQAFELAAAGKPLREILCFMTVKGLRSRRGRTLGPSALLGILTNPFYLGRIRSSGSSAPGAHGPIVEPALWEAAQAGFRARCRNPRSPLPRP